MENLSKEITETVTRLADLIKSDPRYGAVMEAQKAYTEDAQISRLLTEYNVQQAALAEASKGEQDAQLVESIRRRLEELYHQVVENPVYLAYKEASDAYNAFYQAVSQELELALNGRQSGCTHDCSTCSGCH
ncbi:MAG: YlbF family regulator [Clostridiales bacterium]|nr:YlbF family regulator [Clostridiales bacterium]